MNKKVIVLGAGLVGRAIAIDLAGQFEVTAVDINEEALQNLGASNSKGCNRSRKEYGGYLLFP